MKFSNTLNVIKSALLNFKEVTQLKAQNQMLLNIISERISTEQLVSYIIEGDKLFINIEGGYLTVLTEILVKQFLDTKATNYLEMAFTSNVLDKGEHYTLTLQKTSGLTPAQLVQRLQKELAEERSWKNW